MEIKETESVTFSELINSNKYIIFKTNNDKLTLQDNQIEIICNQTFSRIDMDFVYKLNFSTIEQLRIDVANESHENEQNFIGYINVKRKIISQDDEELLTIVSSHEILLSLYYMLFSLEVALNENKQCPPQIKKELRQLVKSLKSNHKITFTNRTEDIRFHKLIYAIDNMSENDILQNKFKDFITKSVNEINKLVMTKTGGETDLNFAKFEIIVLISFLKKLLSLRVQFVEVSDYDRRQINVSLLKQKMNFFDWFKDSCYTFASKKQSNELDIHFQNIETNFNGSSPKLNTFFKFIDSQFKIKLFIESNARHKENWFEILVNYVKSIERFSSFWSFFEDANFIRKIEIGNLKYSNSDFENVLLSVKVMTLKNPMLRSEINFMFSALFTIWEHFPESRSDFSRSFEIIVEFMFKNLVYKNEWGEEDFNKKINNILIKVIINKLSNNDKDLSSSEILEEIEAVGIGSWIYVQSKDKPINLLRLDNKFIIEKISNNTMFYGPLKTLRKIIIAFDYISYEYQSELSSIFNISEKNVWSIEHLISHSEEKDNNLLIGNLFIAPYNLNTNMKNFKLNCGSNLSCISYNGEKIVTGCKKHIASDFIKTIPTDNLIHLVVSDIEFHTNIWVETNNVDELILKRNDKMFQQFEDAFLKY